MSSGGGTGGGGGATAGASGASGGGGVAPNTDAATSDGASDAASDGASDAASDAGTGGAGEVEASCKKPGRVDLEIVLSQAASMSDTVTGGTRWSTATQAIAAFVNAASSNGLGIGIQYFAVPGATSDSCTASDYATPDVAIGTLPAVGQSIITSMNAHLPSTEDALAPAIEGAVSYAKTFAQSNSNDAVGVVVLTDSLPGECTTDSSAIGALAAAGLPLVHTFIVGIGSTVTSLSSVAQAGGTDAIISIDVNQNVSQEIQQALGQIAGSAALSCVPQ